MLTDGEGSSSLASVVSKPALASMFVIPSVDSEGIPSFNGSAAVFPLVETSVCSNMKLVSDMTIYKLRTRTACGTRPLARRSSALLEWYGSRTVA